AAQVKCGRVFSRAVSEPQGTTSYKERYAYFYNPLTVTILSATTHQLQATPEPAADVSPQGGGDGSEQIAQTVIPKTETKASPSKAPTKKSEKPQGKSCCKVCKTSKPCGDSCISKSKSCSKPSGCACSGSDLNLFEVEALGVPIE